MSNDRVMIFIDGANMFHACRSFNEEFRIDYPKLRDILSGDRALLRSYFFASRGVPPTSPEEDFFNKLRFEDFEVETYPLKERDNKRFVKGVDVGLVTKLLRSAFYEDYSTAIVVSGDGIYTGAIKEVKKADKRVEVAAFKNGASSDLQEIADEFIELNAIKEEIKLKNLY